MSCREDLSLFSKRCRILLSTPFSLILNIPLVIIIYLLDSLFIFVIWPINKSERERRGRESSLVSLTVLTRIVCLFFFFVL